MSVSESSRYIVEATEVNFEAEVLERSLSAPVVVDFWAEWCGPCRMLGPVLEALAQEYAGKFFLAKVNTESAPSLAAEFGVRSIPAVFAVRDGQIIDSFIGALPEPRIRAWIDRLLPTPADVAVAEARALEPSDPAGAEAKYRSAVALAPDLVPAKIGLARVLLSLDRVGEATALMQELERRGFLEPEGEKLKAELALRSHASQSGGVAAARVALEARPDDPERKLALAEALAAKGVYDEGLELCLEVVERDRRHAGEAARKTMLNIFQLLPPDSELAAEYRRRLAAALF